MYSPNYLIENLGDKEEEEDMDTVLNN